MSNLSHKSCFKLLHSGPSPQNGGLPQVRVGDGVGDVCHINSIAMAISALAAYFTDWQTRRSAATMARRPEGKAVKEAGWPNRATARQRARQLLDQNCQLPVAPLQLPLMPEIVARTNVKRNKKNILLNSRTGNTNSSSSRRVDQDLFTARTWQHVHAKWQTEVQKRKEHVTMPTATATGQQLPWHWPRCASVRHRRGRTATCKAAKRATGHNSEADPFTSDRSRRMADSRQTGKRCDKTNVCPKNDSVS
ncbi:uncharacterized protein LOC115763522 isoform X2 [Drosophila novamexicana]|uniref:uncharacterized protein LOC115763522 isoform X2 n=1 Tax=Drosophila novamexicana TaxID=47314 RepID=UPI0011E5E09D|nr:uncharacterized protein LOC115763522 isoform X2 [Drosophila novamexicana]